MGLIIYMDLKYDRLLLIRILIIPIQINRTSLTQQQSPTVITIRNMQQDHQKFSKRKYSQQIIQNCYPSKPIMTNFANSQQCINNNNNSDTKQNTDKDYRALYQQEKKKVANLENLLELEKIKTKKLASNKVKGKLCPKCFCQVNQLKKPFNLNKSTHGNSNIKQDLKDFSQKISTILRKSQKPPSMTQSSKKPQAQQPNQFQSPSISTFSQAQTHPVSEHKSKTILKKYSSHSNNSIQKNSFPMVENFTVFGVSEENISVASSESKSVNQLLQGELLYSLSEPSDVDQQTGRFVFPSGVALKRLVGQRARDKAIEMMSFSYANLKSFILKFKCQQNVDQAQYQNNQFLMHINPSKSLFCLCIGIYDYTSVNNAIKPMQKKPPQPVSSFKQLQQKPSPIQSITTQATSTLNSQSTYSQSQPQPPCDPHSTQSIPSGQLDSTQIYISQRVFCISSYYPFFTFYEQILRSLMNIVKMERLMIYKHQNEELKEADSKFQLSRMQSLFVSSMKDLNYKQVAFCRSYELKLVNQQKITLLTDWNLAKTYFIEEWVYAIMSMFNVDTFIDVFTLMMLEDRIVFICNNSHILTYTIYLFTNILTKPFNYAFQVVSIIPEEDFLGAPFPVVYGMLRKRKQIEQSNIYRDYKNTYIYLNPDKVDIVYTQPKKHLLKHRPQRLKTTLTPIFKDLKRNRTTTQKTAKYELQNTDYALTSNKEEKQMAVDIVEKVNEYILQEIVNKMPSSFEIKNMKNSIDMSSLPPEKDQHSVLMEKIKVNVKKNIRDSFADKILDTQMISNMVCK